MNILMLAPEPFFQPRGTPISVYFRTRALSDLGHKVDLVTYHLGENKKIRNMKIVRIPDIFSIQTVKIGPSWTKIPLDLLLFLRASHLLTQQSYDLIFSHEEAALFGTVLSKIWRIPHIYDMHSSLPQQLENFEFTRSRLIISLFNRFENFILKNSQAVIVICLDLLRAVRKKGFESKTVLLENFIDFEDVSEAPKDPPHRREDFARQGEKIVLYTGNFLPYQGIPLLLEAAARLEKKDVVFLLVGGDREAVARMKDRARELNIPEQVKFTGQVPPNQVSGYIWMADALVSPRLSGTNTPLKIYAFLKSGRPLVATNLWTHSQVLDNTTAILVKPDADSLAEGISLALFDPEGQKRAEAARQLAEKEYIYTRYLEIMTTVLEKATANRSQKMRH
ncbi:MAG: glycosyltransferase family 4 protein [Candidatus Aminicenantes bacterium]|jgi:glycosyltransferase involved in cell wall biosynthesis